MLTRYFSILKNVAPYYVGMLWAKNNKAHKALLPLKLVGPYFLQKNLSSRGYPFTVGLYLNKKTGKKVVIKTWYGAQIDLHYYSLVHQIDTMNVLTNVQKRLARKQRLDVLMPNFLGAVKGNGNLSLVMDYVPGKKIGQIQNSQTQMKIYTKCVDYLDKLSQETRPMEKEVITNKNFVDFLFLFPFLLAGAMVMNKNMVKKILSASPLFFIGLWDLTKQRANTLVHGDLQRENIILQGKKIWILDVEQIRFCYPDYEAVSALALKGNTLEFKKLLLEQLVSKSRSVRATVSLLINNVIHNLSGDFPPENLPSYRWCLDKAVELSKYHA